MIFIVYNKISHYLPLSTLAGKNDEIPGVRDILSKPKMFKI